MDESGRIVTISEIQKQIGEIEKVIRVLTDREARLSAGEAVVIEGAAFHIHNYYNAVEDLLRIVAAAFENNIQDASRWHSELFHRMTLHIDGIRPPFLSDETAQLLHRLRSFRHFFRHAYRVSLDGDEIQTNVDRVRQVHPLLLADVATFVAAIRLGE